MDNKRLDKLRNGQLGIKVALVGACLVSSMPTMAVKAFAAGNNAVNVASKNAVMTAGNRMAVTDNDSQQIKVTGHVEDPSGEPIIGATILVEGTRVAGITDINGDFTLNGVADNAYLVVSYLGYQSQRVSAASHVNVVLRESDELLSEVVVVGYGKMTRKDVTSSITTIKAEDMNLGVNTNPAQMLQGKVPGLNISSTSDPNGTPSVILRGASTLRSGAAMEPYYVIDGVPGLSLSTVSPDDIESIDVLRDASATAIYGSKAANGVIIVTTKRAKEGNSNVSYNGYVAFDWVAKNFKMMRGDEYRDWCKDNGFSMEPIDDDHADTDWQKLVQRTGVSTNHNISMSGNSGKTVYNASINYIKNNGVIKNTDMERYIGRAFVETKTLKDRLKLSFNVNGSVTQQNDVLKMSDGRTVYDAMNYYLPYTAVKDENGEWRENPARSQYFNPVSLIEENTVFNKSKRLQTIAKASLTILPELTVDADLSYQNEQLLYNKYYSNKSRIEAEAKAMRTTIENEKKSMEIYANYNKTFGGMHKIGAMLGYSWEESNDNDGFRGAASGFYDDALTYYNLTMGNNVIIDVPGAEDSSEGSFGNHFLSTLRMISFFGRFNYSYNEKYLFQATVRRDGSSAFGANNRWATFPSASVAWRASEEDFIKKLNVFDDLKFRVGYGVSGNSLGFDAFTSRLRYGATGYFTNTTGNLVHTLAPVANANPDLKWERTSMLNIGVDFGFFRNRLTGTIEWYKKNTKDLIYNYTVSTTQYMYNTMTANVGEVSNQGIEFTLNAIPVQTKDFEWNTTLNLSHNKNRVESISNDKYSVNYIETAWLDGRGQTGIASQRIMEGAPIGQFYTWEWAGYDDAGVSVFNDYDEDGKLVGTTASPDKTDQRPTGSAQPKLTLGWNNTFRYKNLSMTMFFRGQFGNKIMSASRARYSQVVGASGQYNLLEEVKSEQLVTDKNANFLSDRYLENGSFLRLQTLTVAYDFGSLGDWVKNLRVYVNANNLFTITGYKGLDPDVYLGGLTPGIDNRMTYPTTRTLMMGVNINF